MIDLAYAGIGSRNITDEEKFIIYNIAFQLKDNFIVYSGNANGSDITFQKGSIGNCVIYLPYKKFNINAYDAWNNSVDSIVCGDTKEGLKAAKEFHPAYDSLTYNTKPLMIRNFHQVNGIGFYPPVKFVICCADEDDNGNVIGGTGQAVRIAKSRNIPCINIRTQYNFEKLIETEVNKYI